MHVLVHDFSGHPFQVELTRELARRGHSTLHLYCASFTTPKGAVQRQEADPPGFRIKGIASGESFEKHSYLRRLRHELNYGAEFIRHAKQFAPEIVLSGNTPLFAQWRISRWCLKNDIPHVFWQQDIYSLAMKDDVASRLGFLGLVIGRFFMRLERWLLRKSAAVVIISEDFLPVLVEKWKLQPAKIEVIHNWAPIESLPARPKLNAWSVGHQLGDKTVFLYTGTLGLKHNPGLLWALGEMIRDMDPNLRLVIASEGRGMQWLEAKAEESPNPKLLLLPFQEFAVYPDVLGSADVLLAILGESAGVFSVPSKILSYHCAGRAILAALPETNLASRIMRRNQTGVIVPTGDSEAFLREAESLAKDPSRREEYGSRARQYAEGHFQIGSIADKFERLLTNVSAR